MLTEFIFDEMVNVKGKLIKVKKDGKFGYLNFHGDLYSEIIYEDTMIVEQKIKVEIDDTWYTIGFLNQSIEKDFYSTNINEKFLSFDKTVYYSENNKIYKISSNGSKRVIYKI